MNGRTGRRLAATTTALIVIGACSSGPAADVADKAAPNTASPTAQ
jgi:hypothetical protein